ncbi:hypothetical protein [Granulibacter bethesdensis]|uniref:hypothetical protein n=1 Tax=Granulibacter bethesdensis TaxID=364410 RepID=UPI000F7B1E4D|nr:hypothetical protein [Granulibacter bethesdensis]
MDLLIEKAKFSGLEPRFRLLEERRGDLQDSLTFDAALIQHRFRQCYDEIHREHFGKPLTGIHESSIVSCRPHLVRAFAILAEELDLIVRRVVANGQLDEGFLIDCYAGGIR